MLTTLSGDLALSLLEEVSYETLVLETWCFTFGGSLVRNAGFGVGASLLEEVSLVLETWRFTFAEISYETLVLETWRFTFGGSLTNRWFWRLGASLFWRKSRTKRWFWRFFEEASHETLVLETWRFTFGGSLVRNAGFGDLALHLWSWTQTWCKCIAGKSFSELDSEVASL